MLKASQANCYNVTIELYDYVESPVISLFISPHISISSRILRDITCGQRCKAYSIGVRTQRDRKRMKRNACVLHNMPTIPDPSTFHARSPDAHEFNEGA